MDFRYNILFLLCQKTQNSMQIREGTSVAILWEITSKCHCSRKWRSKALLSQPWWGWLLSVFPRGDPAQGYLGLQQLLLWKMPTVLDCKRRELANPFIIFFFFHLFWVGEPGSTLNKIPQLFCAPVLVSADPAVLCWCAIRQARVLLVFRVTFPPPHYFPNAKFFPISFFPHQL